MINGTHGILYSTDAEADRAFIRDTLQFTHVDAGDGWLIFQLPPAEIAVHPATEGGRAGLYLMTDDTKPGRDDHQRDSTWKRATRGLAPC